MKVYGFGTRAGSIVGGYSSLADARLIGGSDAPLFVREVGPWEDVSVPLCGHPRPVEGCSECPYVYGATSSDAGGES